MKFEKKFVLHPKKKLLRFVLWFSLANACLFWLIGIRYLFITFASKSLFVTYVYTYTSIAEKSLVLLFTFTSYFGHVALLAFLPCFCLLPFVILFNNPLLILSAASFIWSLCAIGLLADNIIFSLFHFHINFILLKILFNKEYPLINFLELSTLEWSAIVVMAVTITLIEIVLAFFIWKKIILAKRWFVEKKIVGALIGCLLTSYSAFIITIANNNNVLAQQTPNFPLYNNIISLLLPSKNSFSLINRYSETRFSQPLFPVSPLNYPMHPLSCHVNPTKYNILLIAIDTWRFDAMNEELTPNIQKFSHQAIRFENHYSGGNCTQAGLFSLFYGLPSNYWTSMLEQHKGALLIHELLKQGYQSKVFFSGNMIPPFHETIFTELKDVRITEAYGKTIPDHDRSITKEFQTFLQNHDKSKPFFIFLFYDAAHSYYATQNIPQIYPTHSENAQRFLTLTAADAMEAMNRYRNALYFIDTEVQKVLDTLKQQKLLENTLIILTSDHGEEFDDNHLQYWGHGSNYTRYQIQTPFIVYWPGKSPAKLTHQTSHYDVAPFLLSKILGCRNAISDYSVGEDLFKPHTKPYLIVGSYINMGMVEKNRNTTLLTTGNIQIADAHANELPEAKPNIPVLAQALLEMRKYYVNSLSST